MIHRDLESLQQPQPLALLPPRLRSESGGAVAWWPTVHSDSLAGIGPDGVRCVALPHRRPWQPPPLEQDLQCTHNSRVAAHRCCCFPFAFTPLFELLRSRCELGLGHQKSRDGSGQRRTVKCEPEQWSQHGGAARRARRRADRSTAQPETRLENNLKIPHPREGACKGAGGGGVSWSGGSGRSNSGQLILGACNKQSVPPIKL